MGLRLAACLTLTALLAVVGCGAGSSPLTTPSAPASPPTTDSPIPSVPTPTVSTTSSATGSPTAGGSSLTIVISDGTGATTTWTLTCEPPGGSHPDPDGACTTLDRHRAALDPVPADKMCAQVYSGPDRAMITGSWRGEPIAAALARTDSCETARWDALVPLVPSGGR